MLLIPLNQTFCSLEYTYIYGRNIPGYTQHFVARNETNLPQYVSVCGEPEAAELVKREHSFGAVSRLSLFCNVTLSLYLYRPAPGWGLAGGSLGGAAGQRDWKDLADRDPRSPDPPALLPYGRGPRHRALGAPGRAGTVAVETLLVAGRSVHCELTVPYSA